MRSSTAVDQDSRPGSGSERWGFVAGLAFVGWIALTAIVLLLRSPSKTSMMAHEAGAAQLR